MDWINSVPPITRLVLASDISVLTVKSAATSPAPLKIRAHVAVPVLITDPVHCHTGSLEKIGNMAAMVLKVHCHTGSLEIVKHL